MNKIAEDSFYKNGHFEDLPKELSDKECDDIIDEMLNHAMELRVWMLMKADKVIKRHTFGLCK